MPYTAEHKQETRTRIIQSARRLFNRNGFADVTIDQIMDEAGLTRGGFYKHFAAKDELYAAAVLQFICNQVPEGWQREHIDADARGAALARMIVDAYLSDEHFADRDASCPMIALPSDVARGNGAVKGAFRQVLEMMLSAFEAAAPRTHRGAHKDKAAAREQALAIAATVIGGMVLARALDDEALGERIRSAARSEIMARTGWDGA